MIREMIAANAEKPRKDRCFRRIMNTHFGSDGAVSTAVFCWSFVSGGRRFSTFVPRRDSMQIEYDDPNISELLTVFAKW